MAHILVCDDERDVVELVKFMLEKDGHQVTGVYNGQEALDWIANQLPDLIVLDIMMPNVDGYTVNTKLQADERTRGVPVIILTAKGQMRDLFEMAPNVAAYMEKPFNPTNLRDKVKEILANSKTKSSS